MRKLLQKSFFSVASIFIFSICINFFSDINHTYASDINSLTRENIESILNNPYKDRMGYQLKDEISTEESRRNFRQRVESEYSGDENESNLMYTE